MPKNKKLSQLDAVQCQKHTFDAEHDAVRVINVLDQKHDIKISADKDSITTMSYSKVITPESGTVVCADMRKMCGYNSANVNLSPDGVFQVNVSLTDGEVVDLCSIKITVTSGQVVMRS